MHGIAVFSRGTNVDIVDHSGRLLLDLSNELLLIVVASFKYESDIHSLMQTCGRLYFLLESSLYQHNVRNSGSIILGWAALNGVASVVEKMLVAGASPDSRFHGATTMQLAISQGHSDVVKLLLEYGIEPDPLGWILPGDESERNTEECDSSLEDTGACNSPLYKALLSGHESVLQALVSHTLKMRKSGAAFSQLHIDPKLGEQLLEMALNGGHPVSVKFLTEHLPDTINIQVNFYEKETPLVRAIRKGHIDLTRFLLSTDSNPNRTSGDGNTPLYHAAEAGNLEAVQLLLDNGALPDYRPRSPNGKLGHSLKALETAATNGHIAVAQLLLQHINIESKISGLQRDRDALIVIASICGLKDIVQRIIESHSYAKRSRRSKGQRTFVFYSGRAPLSWAAERGHKDLVELLIDHGGNPYCSKIKTPLIVACQEGHTEIVKLLIDKGLDVNQQGYFSEQKCYLGLTSLFNCMKFPAIWQLLADRVDITADLPVLVALMRQVVVSGNIPLLQKLLDNGASFGLFQEHNRLATDTLLDYAVKGGIAMLDFLVQKGALSVKPKDSHAQRILYDAISEGKPNLVSYFLNQGLNPDPKDMVYDTSSLERAALADNSGAAAATMDVLIRHGASIDKLTGNTHRPSLYSLRGRKLSTMTRLLLERGADPRPESNPWAKAVLVTAAQKRTPHYRTIRLLLRGICAQGILLSELERIRRFVEESTGNRGDWKLANLFEDFYWRLVYPVP